MPTQAFAQRMSGPRPNPFLSAPLYGITHFNSTQTDTIVVNNVIESGHPDKLVDVLSVGPLIEPPRGMERVEWDRVKRKWQSVWTRGDVVSTSMVPIASAPSAMVLVNGYTKKDGWEVTGLN